jgi:hypothetical protein
MFHDRLPALPLRMVAGRPALGFAELAPGPLRNGENPELYAIFPYRHFSVGQPQLDLAGFSYSNRLNYVLAGWSQDPIHAAMLGLAAEAKRLILTNYANGDRAVRFPAFWGPNGSGTPDQDNGGVANTALQRMLLQPVGNKLHLFPAWPAGWDADFRLHAPSNTVVRCVMSGGQLRHLEVTPPIWDVVLPGWVLPLSAPALQAPPRPQALLAGARTQLEVLATGGTPMNYQWFFNGQLLPAATDSTLNLFPFQLSHAGLYSVVLSNAAGVLTSPPAALVWFDHAETNLLSYFTVAGPTGLTYQIEYRDQIDDAWQFWTNFTLTTSPLLLPDPDSQSQTTRFYRLGFTLP